MTMCLYNPYYILNQSLTVMQKDGKIWLMDSNGNYIEIVATDVMPE